MHILLDALTCGQINRKLDMDAKDFFREGQRLLVEGKLNESVEAFTKSLEAGEKNDIIFLSRGVAYFRAKTYDAAINDFDIATNMNNRNFRAYFYRGAANMAKEDYEKAIADFEKTIELKPDYGAAFFARGTAYAQLGNEDEATRSINSAITCSEASMQWIADHYGMFRTQFDKSLAFMTGKGTPPTLSLSEDQIETLKGWLDEENK